MKISRMSHPAARRRPRRNHHFRVDDELKSADREPYLAYLREPRATNKSAHAWLAARGYTFSESAVARHMRHVLEGTGEQLLGEQLAVRVLGLAQSGQAPEETFLRASLFRADQLLFEAVMELRFDEREVTPQQLKEYADALERLIDVRRRLGKLAERPVPKEASTPPQPDVEKIAEAVRRIVGGRHPGNN